MPRRTTKKTPASSSSKTLADVLSAVGKMKAQQLVYLLLLVTVFLLGYLFARVQLLEKEKTAVAPGTPTAQQVPNAPVKANVKIGHIPVEGKESAKITIIEFSDFQCPFCERWYKETYPQIKKDFIDTGKAKLYFRHFPLDFHLAAMPAAVGSECAQEQGKFWELHNKIFDNQEKLGTDVATAKTQLKTWAQELGLDTTSFNSCLDSDKYKNKVTEDVNDGKAAGVSGTPTFYINGTQLVGAQPYEAFKAALDAAK